LWNKTETDCPVAAKPMKLTACFAFVLTTGVVECAVTASVAKNAAKTGTVAKSVANIKADAKSLAGMKVHEKTAR
jgi:hypothetical protein